MGNHVAYHMAAFMNYELNLNMLRSYFDINISLISCTAFSVLTKLTHVCWKIHIVHYRRRNHFIPFTVPWSKIMWNGKNNGKRDTLISGNHLFVFYFIFIRFRVVVAWKVSHVINMIFIWATQTTFGLKFIFGALHSIHTKRDVKKKQIVRLFIIRWQPTMCMIMTSNARALPFFFFLRCVSYQQFKSTRPRMYD